MTSTTSVPETARPGVGVRELLSSARRQRPLVGVAAILILLVIGNIISSGFASPANVGSLVAIASILTLLACGQVLVIVAGGEGIDLSVAATASMGAVISSIGLSGGASTTRAVTYLVAVVLIGAVIGTVNGIGITWAKVPPLVMTLGMAQLVAGAVFAYTAGSAPSTAPRWLAEVGSASVVGPVRWLVVIIAVLVVAGEVVLRRTRGGRSLYLTGTNERAAALTGLRTRVIRVVAYAASGVIGSLAGILLLASSGSAQLGMADGLLLFSVAAVIIGGAKFTGGEGSFVGAAIGAVMLTILDSLLVAAGLSSGTRISVQGVILLGLTLAYARERSLRT